jgi:hypothetical protein
MLPQLVSDFLSHFDAGTHIIYFYDTQESKRNLLFSHLRYGQNSQGLAYVCSEESPNQIREEMSAFGLDTKSVRGNNKLTIANYDDVYIVNGKVSIPDIIGRFSKMVDTYKDRGYNGLRAAAEMSCFFNHGMIDDLVAYENALHKRLSFNAEGICAFNIVEMSKLGYLDVFMPLVRAHDPVIFGSPNGYVILKPHKVEKSHAEKMLAKVPIAN